MARGAGNYRRFTEAEKDEMNRLRREGKSYVEISKITGEEPHRRIGDWFRLSRDANPNPNPNPKPVAKSPAAPISGSDFIQSPTRAQLMGRR